MIQMDDIDLNIAKMHEKQTYVSSRDVARQLGISASTVRRRMTRMFESGVIENKMLVDLEAFPELYITFVGMSMSISPDKCIPEIKKIPSVLFLACVTGKYDVIAVVIITSRKMLYKITRQLFEIEGVSALETFVVTDNHGLRVSASTLFELFRLEKEEKSKDTGKGGNSSGKSAE